MENNQSQLNGWSAEQKTGFVLLFIFGILAISLGFLQMRNTIYNPFIIRFDNSNSLTSVLDSATSLQQIDTDKDGLSDYDELQFYATSPYLPDTDSDGISDKKEVDAGTDPLCPEGKSCTIETIGEPQENTKTDLVNDISDIDSLGILGDNMQPQDTINEVEASDLTGVDFNKILNDPAMLRKLLLQTGKITEEQLSKIDDKTLIEMAQKTDFSAPQN